MVGAHFVWTPPHFFVGRSHVGFRSAWKRPLRNPPEKRGVHGKNNANFGMLKTYEPWAKTNSKRPFSASWRPLPTWSLEVVATFRKNGRWLLLGEIMGLKVYPQNSRCWWYGGLLFFHGYIAATTKTQSFRTPIKATKPIGLPTRRHQTFLAVKELQQLAGEERRLKSIGTSTPQRVTGKKQDDLWNYIF